MGPVAALQREVEIAAIFSDALDRRDDSRIFGKPVGHRGQGACVDHCLECGDFCLDHAGGQ
jgi:hypothetical protein